MGVEGVTSRSTSLGSGMISSLVVVFSSFTNSPQGFKFLRTERLHKDRTPERHRADVTDGYPENKCLDSLRIHQILSIDLKRPERYLPGAETWKRATCAMIFHQGLVKVSSHRRQLDLASLMEIDTLRVSSSTSRPEQT